jgi:glycogen synthase
MRAGHPSREITLPKRLLMTSDTIGGVWTYAIELTRALGRFDIEVAMALMGNPLSPAQRKEAQGLANLTLFESTYKLEWMQDPWEEVESAGRWLIEIEQAFEPELVHLNNYAHGALPWNCPVLVVAHSCVLSWWNSVRSEHVPECWDCYRIEVSRGLQAADMVVVPTRAMLDAIETHYGRLRNVRIIANGRTPAYFGAAEKEPFILTVGRIWDEAKNIKMLEAIAPNLGWPICIAGENTHPEGGRVDCQNTLHLGSLPAEEMARWFSLAAIYALPALYEPFGLTVLEAALSDCALILGDIPSLRETWDGAGQFVPPNDPKALEEAIEALMADEASRKEWGARAAKRAAFYSSERMAQGYLDAYRDLLRKTCM